MDINKNGKDDIQEIVDGVNQFIADAKALNVNALVADLKNGAAWAVNEFEALCQEAQTFFQAVVTKVKATAGPLGEQVASVLTLIYNETLHAATGLSQTASDQLKALSSQAITAALGLLGGPAPAAS